MEDRKTWGHQSFLCVSPSGAWPSSPLLLPPSRRPLLSGLAHTLAPKDGSACLLGGVICSLPSVTHTGCLLPASVPPAKHTVTYSLFLVVSPTHLRIKNCVFHVLSMWE